MSNKYSPTANVLETWLDDTVVLLHYDQQKYYSLNSTGSFVWKCVVEGKDRASIETALVNEFAITPEHADSTATRFLGELTATGLIEQAAGA